MKLRNLAAVAAASLLAGSAFASAQDRPILTVYTYSSFSGEFGPGGAIKQSFEAECACTLRWVETEDAGTLLARLQLEGDTTEADIVLGLDTNLIAAARATGLFAEHGLDIGGLDLPVDWNDATYIPFDWGWFAFVYDSEALTDPPTSFAELIADADGPSIVVQDPRTSSPGLGLLLWVKQIFGDEADEAWAALAPRIVTVTRGWSEAYGLFLEGEADMVLSYTTSPAYHIAVEGEGRYRAAIFDEGHMMQVEVAAMVAGTDEPELARAFLAFMVSDGFQSAIPTGNWMYPAVTPADGLPPAFGELGEPPISFLMPPDEVQANRSDWIEEWRMAMTR
jgi:thiamine transport system substrate-binding protein